MAIEITYEAKELDEEGEWQKVTRQFSTEDPKVENIIPKEKKVGIHLNGQTLLVPFTRIYELSIDLDEETVQKMEKAKGQE